MRLFSTILLQSQHFPKGQGHIQYSLGTKPFSFAVIGHCIWRNCAYLRKVAYDNSQRTRRAQLSVEETSHEFLVCTKRTNKQIISLHMPQTDNMQTERRLESNANSF